MTSARITRNFPYVSTFHIADILLITMYVEKSIAINVGHDVMTIIFT